jgi:YhcH/YjgK/YiaL family protein
MIYDKLSRFALYCAIHPLFPNVSNILTHTDLNSLEEGKLILSDGIFVIKSTYETRPIEERFIECHQRFIDVQILLKGQERVGICHREECVAAPYCPETDLQCLQGNPDFIRLSPGNFALFFPNDGHMPQVCVGSPEQVTKVVIKIPVLSDSVSHEGGNTE